MAINEKVTGNKSVAITGTAQNGDETVGVQGVGDSVGVRGDGKNWHGVVGISTSTVGGAGVFGANDKGNGVVGESQAEYNAGVFGSHKGEKGGFGVRGVVDKGTGILGESKDWHGVCGKCEGTGYGVRGEAQGTGVSGMGKTWDGVSGESQSTTGGAGIRGKGLSGGFGVFGESTSGAGVEGRSQSGVGIVGRGGRLAGFFEGDVEVTGDIRLANADCAEDFDVSGAERVEPGTVMVLGEEGVLCQSQRAYDKRVAGVISGAGDYKPGIVLDKQRSEGNRQPVALMGKVFCKVDAQYGAIEVGDLLTTSPTPGHAMKADDPAKAFGTVIGKALRPLSIGQELIPILVALQ